MIEHTMSKYTALTLTLLRTIAGFLFMPHGAQKLFGWLGGMGGTRASASFPDLIWIASVLEFFGGLCILLGVWTPPSRLLAVGHDGNSLLHGSCHAGLLAASQSR
jgi:putative oxidoreductase